MLITFISGGVLALTSFITGFAFLEKVFKRERYIEEFGIVKGLKSGN